jgi:cytochrome bd-type quinol oxidase subunit 2
MRRMDPAAALTFAVDGMTAAAAAWNATWLAMHARASGNERRTAATTLAAVNAGIAVQAIFAQALYTAHRFHLSTEPFFETAPWLASRIVLLAGTLLLSALIWRRSAR